MLRGARKQMIVVRTHDSRVFEEAYFVVRRGKSGTAVQPMPDQRDMLSEANRIIERSLAAVGAEAGGGSSAPAENDRPAPPDGWRGTLRTGGTAARRRRLLSYSVWFFGGLLCGGGTVGLLWLLL